MTTPVSTKLAALGVAVLMNVALILTLVYLCNGAAAALLARAV